MNIVNIGRLLMETAELLQLLGKRWDIIKRLSEKEYYVIELAKALGKKVPQVSLELKELSEKGFVQYEQAAGGGARKLYRLTEFAKTVLPIANRLDEMKTQQHVERWQVDELVSIVEDEGLSEGLRLSYAQTFGHLIDDHIGDLLSNTRVRELLESVLKNPAPGKVSGELAKSVPRVLSFGLTEDRYADWVERRIYPVLLDNINSPNKEIRSRSMRHIVKIALLSRKPKLREEAKDLLLNMYFSKDVEPDGDFGKELVERLGELASKELFKMVRYRTESENAKDRMKAEKLLDQLRESVFTARQARLPDPGSRL
jgi:DNA-binding HxlR family transcriptional regulator